MKYLATASVILGLSTLGASAAVLSGIGTYEGNAGTMGADGVVTAPPNGSTYVYVSTNGGVDAATNDIGYGQGSETNGSKLTTNSFYAEVGDVLQYYFNYVTSDGAGYSDYAYATLNHIDSGTDIDVFNARTITGGLDTVPGDGLPAIDAGVTLDPASTAIIDGGPVWSALGSSSGDCWDDGCGYTGWVKSTYTIVTAGVYSFTFGVVNWLDQGWDSGMAIAGLKIGDTVIIPDVPAVPLPAGLPLILSGLGAFGLAARRRRKKAG